MKLSVIGIDLAKDVIQVRTSFATGKQKSNKEIKRTKFIDYMVQQPDSLIGMEACGSAHYWARKLTALGHTVKLMHPAHVAPFIKGQKNDSNDAEGCSIAVTQPDMRFVPIKTVEQQDMQMILRIKERQEKQQTALANQIRGLLREYGIYIPLSIDQVFKAIPDILEDAENELTHLGRRLFKLMSDELNSGREYLKQIEKEIAVMAKENAQCQLLINLK